MKSILSPILARVALSLAIAVSPVAALAQSGDLDTALELIGTGAIDEAIAILEPLAEAGDAEAQYQLGDLYWNANGVEFDAELAGTYFRRAAEAGLAKAQNALAILYLRGNGVEQDLVEGARWQALAAEQGYVPAEVGIGIRYLNGEGVEQNVDTARQWFELAADHGSPEAAYQLGLIYANGTGVEQDFATALAWTQIAADGGFVAAHYNLGIAHMMGQGVEPDLAQAFFHFAVAYLLSGQGPGGPLFAAVDDLAGQLTVEDRDAGVAAAEEWVVQFYAQAAE